MHTHREVIVSLQAFFDPSWYLSQNPDVAQAVSQGLTTAWEHFEHYGQYEDRSPLALFDTAFYLAQNPDVANAVQAGLGTAVIHFLQYGISEPRLVAPGIDLGAYLNANPDVAAAVRDQGASPMLHLLQYGFQEGRDLGNGISLAQFAADPVFQARVTAEDAPGALARVVDVAPFLPDFVAPSGWHPAADTPIPVDFVAPAGSGLKLAVPAGVKVPEGMTLPDVFEPLPAGGGGSGGTGGSGGSGGAHLPAPVAFMPLDTTTGEGASDASDAIALDDQYMVVADDEGAILRVYDRAGGPAVAEWSITDAAKAINSDLGQDEIDLEAGVRIGDTFYYTGSHSNSSKGKDASEREYLLSVKVTGTGADTSFELNADGIQHGLAGKLAAWDNASVHGKGAGYFGLGAAAADGVLPEQGGGFSIEGMSSSLDDSQLLLGFRAPQTDTRTHEKALIIPVSVDSVFTDAPVFGEAIELNLGGRGIRSIEKAADNAGYLILSGPAGAATDDTLNDFRLYRWDGSADAQGQATHLDELEVRDHTGKIVSLDSLLAQTGGSFESMVAVASLAEGTAVQLLQDNGDTVWAVQTKVSKDLDLDEQHFMGNWVTLGPVAANKAPALVSSNLGGETVGGKGDLVLHFDEAVQWGTGSIALVNTDTQETVQTFNAAGSAAARFAYNVLTLNPDADLDAGNYALHFDGTAVQDLSGRAAAPADVEFTVAEPEPFSLLITEVNSKFEGGSDDEPGNDFFELYNYGSEDINLNGWKWGDSGNDKFGTFDGDIIVKAGEVLVVATDDSTEAGLRNAWHLGDAVHVVQVGGQGLGKGDAVFLYDPHQNLAGAYNYSGADITALDGTVVASVPGGGDKHAGEAAGADDGAVSAVWDGVSVTDPTYVAAGPFGANDGSGTPGSVLQNHGLLITEVNTNHDGGDFFELYNYGTQDIDLTGWTWRDSSGKADAVGTLSGSVASGQVLVVGVDAATVDSLRTAWNLDDVVTVIQADGPGLGKDDAVFLYDDQGHLAAVFNYGTAAVAAVDGRMIAPIFGSQGGHAGSAVGADDGAVSALWDGVSIFNPEYVPATVVGGLEGTPGVVGLSLVG